MDMPEQPPPLQSNEPTAPPVRPGMGAFSDSTGNPLDTLTDEERTMAMLCHLLAIPLSFLGPLIIWLIKKNESAFVDDQGKEALNFQLTLILFSIMSVFFMFFGMFLPPLFCIMFPLIFAVSICALIFTIIGCVKAQSGEMYRYPFAIRFIS